MTRHINNINETVEVTIEDFRNRKTITISIVDLIEKLVILQVFPIFPPVTILNSILETGKIDSGMSGRLKWNKCRLTCDAFQEAECRLPSKYVHDFDKTKIKSVVEWECLCLNKVKGVPFDECLELAMLQNRFESALNEAMNGDNDALIEELNTQYMLAASQYDDFVRPYLANPKNLIEIAEKRGIW